MRKKSNIPPSCKGHKVVNKIKFIFKWLIITLLMLLLVHRCVFNDPQPVKASDVSIAQLCCIEKSNICKLNDSLLTGRFTISSDRLRPLYSLEKDTTCITSDVVDISIVGGAIRDDVIEQANKLIGEQKAKEEKEKAEKAKQEAEKKKQQEQAKKKKQQPSKASHSKSELQSYAHDLVIDTYGWSEEDFTALVNLWNRESGWNPNAHNKSSGAHGIPQSLPASKMASEGSDYYTNGKTQIRWGLKYIKNRYGSPTSAWSHFQNKHWY